MTPEFVKAEEKKHVMVILLQHTMSTLNGIKQQLLHFAHSSVGQEFGQGTEKISYNFIKLGKLSWNDLNG